MCGVQSAVCSADDTVSLVIYNSEQWSCSTSHSIFKFTGIIKVVPPEGWAPPFSVDIAKFLFTPRVQKLNELEAKSRCHFQFMEGLAKFWHLQVGSYYQVWVQLCGYLKWKYYQQTVQINVLQNRVSSKNVTEAREISPKKFSVNGYPIRLSGRVTFETH